jgi:hypothetical protein
MILQGRQCLRGKVLDVSVVPAICIALVKGYCRPMGAHLITIILASEPGAVHPCSRFNMFCWEALMVVGGVAFAAAASGCSIAVVF